MISENFFNINFRFEKNVFNRTFIGIFLIENKY